MKKPIKKIVVVGRDADAWLSAFSLQLSFARSAQPVEVELVELPSDLRAQDFYSVLPSHKVLHKMLGANETVLMRASGGLYSVAQRFSNWSGSAAPFLHAYDTHGIDLANVSFFQYWIKARANGLPVPLEDFSLGAVCAKQGRFVLLDETSRTFSNATQGYIFNAIPYLTTVAKAAIHAGLKHRAGSVQSVQKDGDKISAVVLHDGSEITADLFIDASGTEAILMRNLEGENWEDWSSWLPVDRVIVASAPRLEPVPAFSQISAFAEGWAGFYPLVDRTAVSISYSSKHASSKDVIEKVAAFSGMRLSDAVETTFSAGVRKKQWVGNCVALGTSAVSLDTLDANYLHALHAGLAQLASLLPTDADDMVEADIFNQRMNRLVANVRDFQIAHYKLNKRFYEPFWDAAREQSAPDSLQNKINVFASRGIVAMEEDETFQEESWISLFVGHGLIPTHYNPLVDQTPEQDQIAQFQRILKFIATQVEQMPSLQAQLEMS